MSFIVDLLTRLKWHQICPFIPKDFESFYTKESNSTLINTNIGYLYDPTMHVLS